MRFLKQNKHPERPLPRRRHQAGATLFEYTILVAIISIAGVVLLTSIGKTTTNKLAPVNNGFQ